MLHPLSIDLSHLAAVPIEALLPHRGMMLLLDHVSAFTPDTVTAWAQIKSDAWYADAHGAMPVWIGIELMAQAIAAHVSIASAWLGKPPRPGVLLGTRRYQAHVSAFASSAPLRIDAHEVLRDEQAGYGAYECAISCAGVPYAEAVVKVFQPDDFPSFITKELHS
jgi:predicted hotdog family 3-hydroxylacyl-ACP dehydratase